MRLRISKFTITFVYLALFVISVMWFAAGCGLGPTKYDVPDFYSPSFAPLTPEIVQTTESVTVGNVTTTTTTQMLRIMVTDNSGTPNVSVYARKYGTTAYTKYPMTAQTPGVYTAKLPSDYVSFEYYYSATDGTNTTNYPSTAPESIFSRLVGVPVMYADKYYGISPALVVRPGNDVTFEVEVVTDSSTAINAGYPRVVWKKSTDAATSTLALTATADALSQGVKYRGILATAVIEAARNNVDNTDFDYRIEVSSSSASYGNYSVAYPSTSTYNKFKISATADLPPIAIVKYDSTKKYFVTTDTSGASDIALDGSDSYDPVDLKTGLTYTWKQVTGPTVAIRNSTGALAYFTPTQIGTYSFSLQVLDKDNNKSNVAVTSPDIKVTNSIIPSDLIPAVITSEIVLKKSASPYTVVAPWTIGNGGRLRIERGVELRFDSGAGITVQQGGTINADGDATNRIVMKSNLPVLAKGQWEGIAIESDKAYPASSFNYCEISSAKTAIYVKNSINPTVSNCTINECYDGIYSDNSTVTITQNTITNSGTDAVCCTNGSISTISNNTISKNKRYGIICNASKSEIAKNTISENNYGILVSNSYRASANVVNVFGNNVFKNTDGIRVESADPFVLSNDIYLNNDNGILCRSSLPHIRSNAIHNNRDSGIQMNDCTYRGGTGALVNRAVTSVASTETEIFSNVISFSGADGIELYGSNPIINHNIIMHNANAGIFIKSYSDSAGNAVITGESNGLLVINNLIGGNARSGIARNGAPADYNAGAYFATMGIMINNNAFAELLSPYTDVSTGLDLYRIQTNNNEVYASWAPFTDGGTDGVIFLGTAFNGNVNYLNQNGAVQATAAFASGVMMLHVQRAVATPPTYNDGRNIIIGGNPKIESYSNINAMGSDLEDPLKKVWRPSDIPGNPRGNGTASHMIVDDGTLANVSALINSGTSYGAFGSPNNDIGLFDWVGTVFETKK